MTRFSAFCALLLVLSALSLVSAQYRARQLFIDVDRARAAARKLDVEWRTLQLDQTNYSKNSLIEAAATRDLRMQRATQARTQFITLPAGTARAVQAAPAPAASSTASSPATAKAAP